jgi:hypothetical protein
MRRRERSGRWHPHGAHCWISPNSMLCSSLSADFAWEILQSGFYRGMHEMPHGDAVRLCTFATLGDVGMTLAAFWVVAWLGGRRWPLRPT